MVLGIDAPPASSTAARALAAQAGAGNVTFALGDVYALDAPDDSFDVVHAHQVLQHLGDPVAALREMLRVCRPGGVVAARDADYAAMTWYPADPWLDRWLAIYRAVAQGNGAEPDAGRHLLAWAHAAGAGTVVAAALPSGATPLPSERAWWGGLWADRILSSVDQAAGGRRRVRRRRGDRGHLCGLAGMGRASGRLVRHRARRGALPPVNTGPVPPPVACTIEEFGRRVR